MRLIATDIIEGVTIELYPYGKLKTIIDGILNEMTDLIKQKKEVVHKITDLEHSPGDKYGLLVMGPTLSKRRKKV